MPLREVIKILRFIGRVETIMWKSKNYDALRIAIEALLRIEAGRARGYDYFDHLLPGETKS